MSSITIHGLDKETDQKLREVARSERTSINRTLKKLLRTSLGIAPQPTDHREHFTDLCGAWSDKDLAEFKKATTDFDKVNHEDWK